MLRAISFPIILSGLLILASTSPCDAGPPSMQICLGGGDNSTTSDVGGKCSAEDILGKTLHELHATSHETYVRWSMIEPEKGVFNFDFQDALLAVDTSNSLKWVPFLITGPAYALPSWFYRSKDDAGYVCLEHHQASDIQSLWNPAMRHYIHDIYQAFGRHYDGNPHLESVLLGISGNYGESLVPISGMDWTTDGHGKYHSHPGWWVGDKYAEADFRKRVQIRYPSLGDLNSDWKTTFTSFAQVHPRLPEQWPSDAARQFEAQWMLGSMTDYADWCMKEAREFMPHEDIYLVVGGHAPACHGLDATAQVKAAAARGCGVRITNESDGFAKNFAITRIISSAAHYYGTFCSYEPAGAVSQKGIAARVFNAATSGLRCLHWYENLLHQDAQSRANWEAFRRFASNADGSASIDTAVFYPRHYMNLQALDQEIVPIYGDFAALRNATDYDFVDERMLTDMKKSGKFPFKHLLIRSDFLVDSDSSASIEWLKTLKPAPEIIFYDRKDVHGKKATDYLRTLAMKLHPAYGFAKNIFWSQMADGAILFLNDSNQPADLHEIYPRLPPHALLLAHSMTKIAR